MRLFVLAFYAQIMEEIEKYSKYDLEQLSYRILQQVAKSMSLPSNVKKMYLVQLIHTKTHGTATELESIIQKVRYERQLLSQTSSYNKRKGKKRMRLQATEVTSTNRASMSPPIDLTPKRSYSPEMLSLRSGVKYCPKNTSDRVLRSYNVKSYKRPNYSMMNNAVVELMKSERSSPKEKETQISIVSHEGRLPCVNVTARCVVRKLRPASPRMREHQACSVNTHTQTLSSIVPLKRARTLSGIYPIPRPEIPLKTNYECIQAIGFRHTDGKISKINAVVQKPAPKITYGIYDFDSKDSYKNVEVTIQDIINSNIDSQTFTNPSVSEYTLTGSNVGSVQMPSRVIRNSNELNSFSVYCHKKIRAEQLRTKRSIPALPAPRPILANVNKQRPPYTHTYSRINAPRHLTRPIYVQVGGEEAKILSGPLIPRKLSTANRGANRENCDATRDVTKGLLTQVSTMKVPTSQAMCLDQRLPYNASSCDVTQTTHALVSTDEKANSPSLIENKMADEEPLPLLSDLYVARDVTHTTDTSVNAEDNIAHKPAEDQSLPILSDVYSDVTPTVDQPVDVNEHANQSLPNFSDVFSEASHDVTQAYTQICEEEKRNAHSLPKFSDVFSEASHVVTQAYVQICEEEKPLESSSIPCKMANEMHIPAISAVLSKLSDPRSGMRPLHPARADYADNEWSLEAVYTLKSAKQPSRSHTHAHIDTSCVYSTHTITTAAAQTAPAAPTMHTSFESVEQYAPYGGTSDEVSRICDAPFAEQDMTLRRYHEAESRSSSSASRAPTIPELVEDALEIISQDGDYMERIGMDVRMQCILCSWAGSKIILEYHLRKEHHTEIIEQDKNEWNVTYKLSSLVNQEMWLSHVCDRDSTLYILSVKYEQPDCLMASLTTLSIADTEPKYGTITLYNKVTGEPYTWHGLIPQLPSNMPYENDHKCLRIELSKLELLPNSANLKLINKELVLQSPAKVVVGQPELNDIHIIIFVQVHDV